MPSRAARKCSPRVPSPQPRFPGKRVCSLGRRGAYPRHMGVGSASGISTVRCCVSHTALSCTIYQALDLPSDTATVVYVSLVSRGGGRNGGRNRKSHVYRGLCDTSRQHITILRWSVVGCVQLAAVWVCCLLGAQSGVLSFYPAAGKSTKGPEPDMAICQQGEHLWNPESEVSLYTRNPPRRDRVRRAIYQQIGARQKYRVKVHPRLG